MKEEFSKNFNKRKYYTLNAEDEYKSIDYKNLKEGKFFLIINIRIIKIIILFKIFRK